MSDKTNIRQTVEKGDNSVQIAEQNNYFNNVNVGMNATDACELAIKLFYENFPKLEEKALETVNKRVDEFKKSLLQEFANRKIIDFSALSEPDVQFALVEAQKTYARFGEENMLEYLAKLVVDRIENDNGDISLKVAIDQAIKVIGLLNSAQLDYLSLIFIVKSVRVEGITNCSEFQSFIDRIAEIFKNAAHKSVDYLNMLGCFKLNLGSAIERLHKAYPFLQGAKINYPQVLSKVPGDYGTSQLGAVLAIVNAQIKSNYRFDMKIWIHS